MNRRMVKNVIKQEFQKEKEKSVPCSAHVYQTARRAADMWEIRRSFGPDAGFLRLLASQVRCMGKLSLGLQLLIFIFVLIVVTALTEEGPRGLVYLQNKGVLILCVSAVAAAWSSVPAFARSFRHNMAELEEASYFSLSRLMMARIVVCMGSAGIMAASIGGFVFVRNIVCFNELAAYLILPFLLSVACVFYFMLQKREHLVWGSTISLILVAGAFLIWRKVWGYDGSGSLSAVIWVLCALSLLACLLEIWKLKKTQFYFEQEGEEMEWNFV